MIRLITTPWSARKNRPKKYFKNFAGNFFNSARVLLSVADRKMQKDFTP